MGIGLDMDPVWEVVDWRWSPGLLRLVELMELGTACTTVSRRVWLGVLNPELDRSLASIAG